MRICPDCAAEYQGPEEFCKNDGSRLTPAAGDPLLGRQLGSYKLVRLLGQGGMGQVYLGIHPGIGSRVAIKLLDEAAASRGDLVERFFAEATAVNKIRHENIVNVLDLDRLDGSRPYIVMEFLEGRPLSSVIAHFGRLPLGTLTQLAAEILSALDAAHRAGIVHRDLKPDNIFVSPQGRAKVLDFGIAKLLPAAGGGPVNFTHTGMVLGTPAYMSPEQVTGAEITPATDIYALSTILYECATGSVPFAGSSLYELLHHQVHSAPAPPSDRRPELPAQLEAVLLRALAKDPAARYPSAAEMMAALGPATAGLPPEQWASISLAGSEPALIAESTAPVPTPEPPGSIPAAHAPTALAPDQAPSQPPPKARQTRPAATLWIAAIVAGIAAAAAVTFALLATGDNAADPVAAASALDASPASVDAATELATAAGSPPAIDAASGSADTTATAGSNSPPRSPSTGARSGSEPGVTTVGSVTIVNTAEKAAAATGLEPIARRVADTDRFDAIKFLPQAQNMARSLMPDAVLVHWEVDGVSPGGLANLDIADHEATYRFRSPARSKRPPDVPRGVEVDIPCLVYVDVSRGKAEAYPTTDEECDDKPRPRPRCSLAQVWKRAYALGAPKGNWVASVDYLWDGWFFDIKNGSGSGDDFTESIPDDC